MSGPRRTLRARFAPTLRSILQETIHQRFGVSPNGACGANSPKASSWQSMDGSYREPRPDFTLCLCSLDDADRRGVRERDDHMRILFHHRIASRDGQAVHIDELIDALRALGHDVVLVGPDLNKTPFGRGSGLVEWFKASLPPSLYELIEIGYNIPAFFRLERAVRAHRPDVIYERYSLFLAAGIMVHRMRRIPLLLEVNGPLYEERAKNDGLSLHWVARRFQRLIWNSADYLLPVTGVLASIIRGYGVPQERIVVIPNGINPSRFRAPSDRGAAKAALSLPAALVLGFTGFVRRWHALDRVLDFLAENGERFDLHFLLVGDGPAREELIAQARAKGIPHRLTVTGIVSRDDVARYVAAFDIALQVGITEYASPLKLFEYMYMGRAIVAPATPNIREVLTDGHDALLFDPSDPGSLDDALTRLCGDPALRARLGSRAHATILEKKLTWQANAMRIERLCRSAEVAEANPRVAKDPWKANP
jgi:glycosyltransferase involved in cell wall biosynthesis